MDEQKRRDNFVRIAERRVNTILNGIRSLRQLTNKSFYKYDQKDVDDMFTAIKEELKTTRSVFTKGKNERFKL